LNYKPTPTPLDNANIAVSYNVFIVAQAPPLTISLHRHPLRTTSTSRALMPSTLRLPVMRLTIG
jgi:hypothetical protein